MKRIEPSCRLDEVRQSAGGLNAYPLEACLTARHQFHAGLRYDFRMRTTSRSGGSYLNNVVSLTLTAYF